MVNYCALWACSRCLGGDAGAIQDPRLNTCCSHQEHIELLAYVL